VARDLFVHHFGSRTFLGNGIDIDGLLEENARRFGAKWALTGGNNGRQVVAIRPWRRPEGAVGNGVSAGASAGPCANPGGRGSVTRHKVSREIATRCFARNSDIKFRARLIEYRDSQPITLL
jgi:hypothetical protein